MNTKKSPLASIISVCLLFLLITLGQGSGSSQSAMARGEEKAEASQEILKTMPLTMPKDYSDEEIDRMLEDIQEVDDSADIEGAADGARPDISGEDKALGEKIKQDPEPYADDFKSVLWLNAHPWVVWYICSDYEWLEAHPRIAARIYLNYGFWHRYPRIAYIIVCNRPFLNRYPGIAMVVYDDDLWFLDHPFVAREVYRNYQFFHRHPHLYERYYRHREWMLRHPGVARIAYPDRALYRNHPEYLERAYEYRRMAVRDRLIRDTHMQKMQERMKFGAAYHRPEGSRPNTNRRPGGGHEPDHQQGADHRQIRGNGRPDRLIRQGETYKPDRNNRHGARPEGTISNKGTGLVDGQRGRRGPDGGARPQGPQGEKGKGGGERRR
ncbi:MAG: hypothetical protein KA369_23235 [Spirochaetes bacterium]|nr:hypothetical protein [Spirochaetota bacterium]